MSARAALVAVLSLTAACGRERSDRSVFAAEAFDLPAAGALMVLDPTHPDAPGWRPLCGVALVHPRVALTAGHCIQFLRAGMASGALESVWVSFQAHPRAPFRADPAQSDPAGTGWYRVGSVHASPDTPDFVALRQSDTASVLAAWGDFHDSGAIILANAVVDVVPLRMAGAPGEVERRLERAGCGREEGACRLVKVSYGPQGQPAGTAPLEFVRHAAQLRVRAVDSLFVHTFDDAPGSAYGRTCPGDSGSPIVLLGRDAAAAVVVAIVSSPAEPFGIPCTGGALQYRVDTPEHRRFVDEMIRSANGR